MQPVVFPAYAAGPVQQRSLFANLIFASFDQAKEESPAAIEWHASHN
jgi:hypothetical protein